jgi:hypothetical protein
MKSKLSGDFPCRTETENRQNERKVVNDKFDELAKNMAQSVTRRGALKKFGVAVAGIVLASLGLASNAEAAKGARCANECKRECANIYQKGSSLWEACWRDCVEIRNCYFSP